MALQKFQEQAYAILRIAAGFLFIWHGTQKFFGFPVPGGGEPYVVIIAGSIEFIGGFLIIIGLWTNWIALLASGEMAYAYWTVHAPAHALPIANRGELAVLYCFIFLLFAAKGAGIWSLDNMMHLKKNNFTSAPTGNRYKENSLNKKEKMTSY